MTDSKPEFEDIIEEILKYNPITPTKMITVKPDLPPASILTSSCDGIYPVRGYRNISKQTKSEINSTKVVDNRIKIHLEFYNELIIGNSKDVI